MKRLALIGMLMGSLMMAACGVDEDPEQSNTIPQTYRVSECGGFSAKQRSTQSYSGDYCAAEVLDWSYDAKAGKLKLADNRVLLNCCGDHSVKVTKKNGTYVITETDAPQKGLRCHCMCVFDFELTIDQLSGGVIPIELVRDVTDDVSGPKTVYKGQLDLSKSAGSEVIDTKDASVWCDAKSSSSNDTPSQTYAVSECGGFDASKTQQSSKSYSAGGDYCAAEMLEWTFDAQAGTLKLSDDRVLLNCCGDHSVKVTKKGAGYVITELDAPDSKGGRCFCMCVFDFAVSIKGVKAGLIPIELVRDVTDDNAPAKTVFKGTLDLSKGAGAEVVSKTSVGAWCGN